MIHDQQKKKERKKEITTIDCKTPDVLPDWSVSTKTIKTFDIHVQYPRLQRLTESRERSQQMKTKLGLFDLLTKPDSISHYLKDDSTNPLIQFHIRDDLNSN